VHLIRSVACSSLVGMVCITVAHIKCCKPRRVNANTLLYVAVLCVDHTQSQATGAAQVTVEHSSESDRGGARHTRITVHRVGPSGPNPFQEYVPLFISFFLFLFYVVQDNFTLHIFGN